MLGFVAAAVIACASANTPPNTPVITEPAFDGRIVNPEDVHMETAPFSDPDPGDTHLASDWEIWTVSPPARIWAALGITGVERVHIHLGDGTFQGAYAGRTSLLPNTDYQLRTRHEDSSGDPLTQWSGYALRAFSSGSLSTVFPMDLDDAAASPAPTWLDTTGVPVSAPDGATPATLNLESSAGDTLLVFTGGQSLPGNPPALGSHIHARVRIAAGGQVLVLPETNLAFTDGAGVDRAIYLPSINLQSGQTAFFWIAANGSSYVGQAGQTQPDFSTLARGAAVPWTVAQPGFKVEVVATGFQLPVNIAFVPSPGAAPSSPIFYVTELYGSIKVVRRDSTIGTYASGLLNFDPTGDFPGSGEQGLTGIAFDPASGDIFAVMLYDSAPPNGDHYPKIVRFHSADGGQTAATQTIIRNMVGETQGQSHQISNCSIGPDGKLYVHLGDGFDSTTSQNLDSYRGKILRMNLDGSAPTDNPFYNATGGINSRDYVFAYGFRNPFGGVWRAADSTHYEVENGPSVDRFARVVRGRNYLWDGSDASMSNFAIYNWSPAHAPVNIAFVQQSTFGGSQFPAAKLDHAFVAESGPTYGTGPQPLGKRISEFVLDSAGNLLSGPATLVEYNGSGKASCVGLAAGPDGLYFTDMYKDIDYQSPIDPGANIMRIRYVGAAAFSADVTTGPAPLSVHFTDLSTVPSPASWLWSFGDGASSTSQNPTHIYAQDGAYNVRLAVTGTSGAAVAQINAYIKVGRLARVAMICGSVPPAPADQAIADHLSAKGFIVDTYDDDPANRPTAAALGASHDLAIISSTITAANVAGEFRTVPVPLVFWEQALLRTDREALADSGVVVGGATTVNIVNTGHPITQGMNTGDHTVFNAGSNMSVGIGNLAATAGLLALRSGSTDAAILTAEQGSSLLGGYIAPARRVFLFLEDNSFLYATPQAVQIFDRAVCWAANLDPSITSQPASITVPAGQPASFSVSVSGAGPVGYQWRRGGAPLADGGRISGATSATLTINPAATADAGSYDVMLAAPCGQRTSNPAVLTVSCYPNCDNSTTPPVLNVLDFTCFLNKFAAGDPYANCDQSTVPPTLNVLDFTCFLNAFAAGCP